jgi:H+/gluconate symporter-like permease
MYAKIIGDSGTATTIANWILKLVGEKNVYIALIILTMLLTYGGINGLILIFVFWPLAVPLAKKLNKPRYLFIICMYIGFLTGAYSALPGTPQNSNVFAAQALGTSATAAPVLGIIATIIMFVFDFWFIGYLVKRIEKKGRTFEENVGMSLPVRDVNDCPPLWSSLTPIIVLLAIFILFSNGLFGLPKLSAVIAVTSGNVIASAICLTLNWKYVKNAKDSIIQGLASGLSPACNMFMMIAFTAVVSVTPAYKAFTGWVMNTGGHPYFQAIIASQLIGLVTASGGATVQFTCSSFAESWLAYPGINPAALTRIVSISSIGFSCGPHAGGLFSILDVSGANMKDTFLPYFISCGLISLFAVIVCACLAMAGIA